MTLREWKERRWAKRREKRRKRALSRLAAIMTRVIPPDRKWLTLGHE